jgi:predicted O-methyltransferase YrrM
MSNELWSEIDHHLESLFLAPDPTLEANLRESLDAGLPAIQVSSLQGKLLHLLAVSVGAKRILEIGTLGGYSTTWLARALPLRGRLVTLEFEPLHVRVARENLERSRVGDKVDIRVGAALDTLQTLVREGAAPFDFIFIDADKENYAGYLEGALKLSRPGTLIVADNVVRAGEILDAGTSDARAQGIRAFLEKLSAEKRVDATVIQTVGSKGHDGLAVIRVL